MYINTGHFGEEQSEAREQPGFLKSEGSVMQPKQMPEKVQETVLNHRLLPEENAKLLAKKDLESSNPQVNLLKTELLNKEYAWQVKNLQENLDELKKQVNASGLYADMLKQYLALVPTDRRFVHTWIKTHETAIRKFKSGRDLEQKSKELQNAIDLINAQIDYQKGLHTLKSQGVDIREVTTIKQVAPAEGTRIESGVYDTPRVMPNFLPETKNKPVNNTVKKVKRILNLGETDASRILLSPIVPKDKREEIALNIEDRMFNVDSFAENLPGQRYFNYIRKKVRDKETLATKKSKTVVDNFWEKKEIKALQKEILQLKQRDQAIKVRVKSLLDKIKDRGDEATKLDTTVLGILLSARPESFVAAPTLMEGLRGVFARLTDIEKKSVEEEAAKYLKINAEKSEVLLKQLIDKESELAVLKGETPKPQVTGSGLGNFSSQEKSYFNTAITFLPWLIAAIFAYKIYTGR